MRKYFKDIKNKKELVKAYRQLAKRLHPDCGGNAEEFKAMSAEFNSLLSSLPDAGEGTEPEAKSENQNAGTTPEMSEILKKVIHLDGIEIEICGSWIWVSGNTYPVKDTLKAAGFKFSGNKKMWYWHSGECRRKSRKSLNMDDIRERHGSVTVRTQIRAAIA